MPKHQPKDPETQASAFDQMLVEATESDLQEVIDEAPRLFRTQPLELLLEFKALVDARLAAEPENNVISMSDPHQIRVLQWDKIADRLQAEINFRISASARQASGDIDRHSVSPGAGKEHAVAARRTIVQQNSEISGKELCELLDREGIRPPKGWPEAGFKTWVEAWQTRQANIQVIFSKDRKSS